MRVRHKPWWYLGPLASGSPTAGTQGMHHVSCCMFWLNVFDCWRYMHGVGWETAPGLPLSLTGGRARTCNRGYVAWVAFGLWATGASDLECCVASATGFGRKCCNDDDDDDEWVNDS